MKKTILITGASSGFGFEIAQKLHQAGHQVFGTSRNPDNYTFDFKMVKMDVTSEVSIQQGVSEVVTQAGKIDVLINNAGVWLVALVEETTLEQSKAHFDTNYFGALAVIQAVLPTMRAQKRGHIINVSSIAGLVSIPGLGVYSATKHALEGVSKALYYELKQFNIDVSLVKPGSFKTEILGRMERGQHAIKDYNAVRGRLEDQHHQAIATGADPALVADLMLKIVESNRPKLHYLVGPNSRIASLARIFPRLLDPAVKQFGF